MRFFCPYLRGEVEWTEERQRHVAAHHPDLLPDHRNLIPRTIDDPDEVRRSVRFGNARSFSRCFSELRDGKHVVVVVISDEAGGRYWIITPYMARKLTEGVVEWKRS